MIPKDCLWVKEARIKGHPNPEKLRCHKNGAIFCGPCLVKLHPDSVGAKAYKAYREPVKGN